MKPDSSLLNPISVIRAVFCVLICGELIACALGADGVNPSADRNARFFAAQMQLLEGNKSPEVKQRERDARGGREAARADRDFADRAQRQSNISVEEKERQARKATLSECKAEAAQIAFEEAMLAKVLADDPSISDVVESQRKEIVLRKRMLALIEGSAKQQTPRDASRAADEKTKKK